MQRNWRVVTNGYITYKYSEFLIAEGAKSASPRWKSCASRPQLNARMLNKDFEEFAGLLNSIGVEYLDVGGYALAAHGHPRHTGDLERRDLRDRLRDLRRDFGKTILITMHGMEEAEALCDALRGLMIVGGESVHGYALDFAVLFAVFFALLVVAVRLYPSLAE